MLVLSAIVGVLCGVILAVIVSLAFPFLVRSKIESRLQRVEEKLDVTINIEEIVREGISGAELRGVEVIDNQNDNVMVRADVTGASVSIWALIRGDIVVTDLWADRVDVTFRETEDGTFDLLDKIRNRKRSEKKETTDDDTEEPDRPGILGDSLPELNATDIQVNFHSQSELWPIQSLTIPEATIDEKDTFNIEAAVTVESKESDVWSLPSETTVSMQIDSDDIRPVGGYIKFDKPVRVSQLPKIPFVVAGFSNIAFDAESNVTIDDIVLDFGRVADPPFFASKQISFSLIEWPSNPRDIRINKLSANSPSLNDHVTADGRSKLYDLRHMIQPSAPGSVVRKAMDISEALARKTVKEPKDDDLDDADSDDDLQDDDTPPPDADPVADEGPSRFERLADLLPRHVDIKGASMRIDDERKVDLDGWAKKLEARETAFEFISDVENKSLKVDVNFSAFADGNSRGKVNALLGWAYETQKLEADVKVEALDLLWFSQIAGPEVAQQLRGGTLRANIDVTPLKGRAVKIKGLLAVNELSLFHEKLAEEPISDFSASYNFVAKYDPAGTIPAATHLKTETLPESVPKNSPYRRGSFEVQAGTAKINDVELSFRPEIYGTAALPRLPSRVDLAVELEEIETQKVFEAVPKAILGPIDGAKFAGTLKWKLSVEVPLLHAKDMKWSSVPILDEFEIVRLPHEVDVRRIGRDMKILIEDEIPNKKTGEPEPWSRKIYIPTFKRIPDAWIVENMSLEQEELDEIRERHPWPKDLGKTTSSKAGTEPYTFVRLPDITPLLTRAILTTEDKGFWHHDGISFVAMRESFAQNLRAGRIRRGGSTIAMQLVKNLFLDRQKIYARKLREVFLVYLMIHVANIPRERLLEVYFNVIEFAPEVYGIHDGAVHYFGKVPADLTLGEVAWLVSIIPGPKRRHFYWERGAISDSWFRRMSRYINLMYKREKVTEEEKDEALLAAPEFYKPGPDDPPIKPKTVIPLLPLDDGPVIPFDL